MNIQQGATSLNRSFPDIRNTPQNTENTPIPTPNINHQGSICSEAKYPQSKPTKQNLADQTRPYQQEVSLNKKNSPRYIDSTAQNNFYNYLEQVGSRPKIIDARSTHKQEDELARTTHEQGDELARTTHDQSVELA